MLPNLIRRHESPVEAGLFSIQNKDGGLIPCIDEPGLNSVTVKYREPLPLVHSTLEQLCEAWNLHKFDLRRAYIFCEILLNP